jgi:hypothetical protein
MALLLKMSESGYPGLKDIQDLLHAPFEKPQGTPFPIIPNLLSVFVLIPSIV